MRDGPVSCQKPVESLPGGKFFPRLAQKASAFPSPSVRLLGKLELFGTHCFKTLTAERRDQLRLLPESFLPLGWLHEECFAFLSFFICFLLLILGVDDKQRSCNLMIPACKFFVQADTSACCCACVSVPGQPGTMLFSQFGFPGPNTHHLIQQESLSPSESSHWPQGITFCTGGGWKNVLCCPTQPRFSLFLSDRDSVAQAGLEHYTVADDLKHFSRKLTLPPSDLFSFVTCLPPT